MSVAKIPAPASASFDEAWYLDAYPDVAAVVGSHEVPTAYAHWLASGQFEGRQAPPGFLPAEVFDEQAYLQANPDVAEAMLRGVYRSGREHFQTYGSEEGRNLGPPAVSDEEARGVRLFDEAWYLKRNPDIAQAVANGTILSGYAHWVVDGRIEGRSAPPGYNESLTFDEAFYLRAYPQAAGEIAAERALTPRHHYDTIGRFRGYLPNDAAERPGEASPRCGLWFDQPDALDLIEGRWELGRLSPEQAELLHHWVRYGYVILPRRLPADLVDAASAALLGAFDGAADGVRFDCPELNAYHPVPWDPAVKTGAAMALDLHWLLPAVRELVLAAPVRAFLELLFERKIMAARSVASLHGAGRPLHRDTPQVPFSLGQSAAAWIALEDVPPGAGEITYFAASHKLPVHLYGGRYRTLWDAHRMLQREAIQDLQDDDSERLEELTRAEDLPARHFTARKGDVMLWHPDLVHGELAPGSRDRRAAILTHYCPREVAPLTFERGTPAIRSFAGLASYATAVYREP